MPQLLPILQNTDLVTFEIEINGEPLPVSVPVLSIEVTREINRIPTACIYLDDGDASKGEWPVSSADYFVPGNEIIIYAGYHSENEEIFTGIVTAQALRARFRRVELQIMCKDKAIAMTTTKKSRHFEDVTDGDAITTILDEYGIVADIAATELTHPDLILYDGTDWDFMIMRMEANGLVCSMDGIGLHAIVPDVSIDPIATVEFGNNIIEFDADIDARRECGSVIAKTWSQGDQDIAEAVAAEPAWTTVGNLDPAAIADSVGAAEKVLRHGGVLGTEELQAWSDATLLRSRMSMMRGRVRVQGFASMVPGSVIDIVGMGDRFNGKAWVGAVRHEIAHGNWLIDIEFGMPDQWHAERFANDATSAQTLLQCVPGLHTGIVTSLEDPDGEARIRVKIPSVDLDGNGIWARVATLDAGDGRGTFFLPELEDEVIVGFLNDDPRHPVILGMVHSSAKPPPEEASDDNHIKAYYSRSGMRLLFDDESTTMTLDTPGGHSIVMDDDAGEIILTDSNSNAIKMSSSGIEIESAGDLILTGAGDVKVEGGTNVELKASAQWKAEGSAGAELNSSAITVVKGSLVQIN